VGARGDVAGDARHGPRSSQGRPRTKGLAFLFAANERR
jgi:hypothetical protein